MRVAIGQFWQETNTFNPRPTTVADFEAFGIHVGDEVVRHMAETNELGGFIQSLRQWPEHPEIVGLFRYAAWPGGPLVLDDLQRMLASVYEAFQTNGPFDGVLLALHGSLVAEEVPDVEGHVLENIRHLIGSHVPLVATLDLHANITKQMVKAADALVLYHTAPHIDVFNTGRRAARLLHRILVEKARPVSAYVKIPAVVPVERANTQDPASVSFAVRARLQQWEADPRVLTAGLATVQPWLDVPDLGNAAVVVTDGEPALARELASELAGEHWARRHDYGSTLVEVAAAVRQAYDQAEGLTVLGDGADATTSGSTGDGTAILEELLRHDWPRPVLVPLVAPELVEEARRRGVGAKWAAKMGGIHAPQFARSITARMQVERLFEARFVLSGHLAERLPINMGPAAVLRHGQVRVLATSHTGPHFAPQFFEAAGFDPFAASVVVAKSPCGFRAAYEGRARQIIMVRAPGCSPSDFWNYPYRHIPRPLWPWDEIPAWAPTPLLFSASQ